MSSMSLKVLGVAAAAGVVLGCDVPPVAPTSDPAQNVATSRIEGEAVVAGAARGNLVIFRFDAARPPPPTGTGRPESFTIVPREQIFGDAPAGTTGPFTASYSFSLVPEGRYLLRGFLDADGAFCPGPGGSQCRVPDFNPWYGVTGEPNRGDVGGAAVDALTLAFRTVTIARGEGDVLNAATGVSFTVQQGATTVVPADRPAFAVNTSTTNQQFVVATSQPCSAQAPTGPRCKLVDVVSAPVYGGAVDQRAPAFLVRFIDNNNDCVADDINGDGQPDFWPRVFVRKQADVNNPALLVDENDWDHDGVVDSVAPAGVSALPDYPHANGSLDGKPDAVLLAAGIVPDSTVLSQLVDGSTGQPRCTLTSSGPQWPVAAVNSLKLAVQSVALDVADPSVPVLLRGVPPGKYALTLMQFTGQTWRLPNELQPGVAAAAGLPETLSQGWYLDVQ
ncbi:MAG TPA: hypothetical protein VND93_30235 [Myxococcales bacterium]|nr:hypothetical protein [Myxococcales bacterium]